MSRLQWDPKRIKIREFIIELNLLTPGSRKIQLPNFESFIKEDCFATYTSPLQDFLAGSTKRLASRFYLMKTGHCLTGQYLQWTGSRPMYNAVLVVPAPNADAGPPFQGVSRVEGPTKDPMSRGAE